MGQYGNQPDFGTIVTPLSEIGFDTQFPPSAIYIGQTTDNDGTATLTVQIVGNEPGVSTTITGISSGAILPFIVTEVKDKSGMDNNNIYLYR
jgi:hypothetical protein